MVTVQRDASGEGRRYVLQPDIGFHWRQASRIFLFIAASALGVALALTLLGYWPVLLFAALEVIWLGGALYISAARGRERELIQLRGDKIEVQKGRQRPDQSWVWNAFWIEVALVPPVYRWYPSRLTLRAYGEEVEIGRFLREEERVDLALDLKRRIGPMATSGKGA